MIKRSAIICIILCLLAGCQYYYVPRAHYIPVFKQKGDLNINLGIAHQQIGYAITDNLGLFFTNHLQKNISLYDATDCSGNIEREISGLGQTLGLVPYIGYEEILYFEAPVALGLGNISGNGSIGCGVDYYSSFKTRYQNLSIQPTFTYRQDNNLEISLFGRLSVYRSHVLESHLSMGKRTSANSFDKLMNTKNNFYDSYLDLGIEERVGFKNIKAYLQVSLTFLELSSHRLSQQFSTRAGLSFNFNLHKKRHQDLSQYKE